MFIYLHYSADRELKIILERLVCRVYFNHVIFVSPPAYKENSIHRLSNMNKRTYTLVMCSDAATFHVLYL